MNALWTRVGQIPPAKTEPQERPQKRPQFSRVGLLHIVVQQMDVTDAPAASSAYLSKVHRPTNKISSTKSEDRVSAAIPQDRSRGKNHPHIYVKPLGRRAEPYEYIQGSVIRKSFPEVVWV
jgi:hypothetical protein